MKMEHTGWPASVASKTQYKMRSGRIARVTQYSISNNGAFGINEVLTGETVGEPAELVQWTANGDCTTVHKSDCPAVELMTPKPDTQYDLVEAIRGGK